MAKDIKYTAALDPSGFLRGTGGMLTALGQVDATAKGVVTGVQGRIDGLVGKFGGWSTVFTGLAASIGLISFASMVKGAIDGAGALKQLSEQSGLSVERLSALKAVAKLSDTAIEDVASASNKLSKNMAMADEKSAGAAQALKAVGLSVGEFKALSADDRLQVLAKTLAQYEDGADKSAVAMALMGKEGAKLLPFMNDLAETGALQARTTAAQAAQADELDKNFKRIKASSEGWKRELAYGMLPALNDVSRAVLDVFNGTGGLREEIKRLSADGSLGEWTRSAITAMTYFGDVIQVVWRAIKTVVTGIVGLAAAFGTLAEGGLEANKKLRAGDWSGYFDQLGKNFRQAGAAATEAWGDIKATWGTALLGSTIRDRMESMSGAAAAAWGAEGRGRGDRAKLNFQAKPDKDGKEAQGRLPEWEAALAERKLKLAELANAEGSFRELSKAEEAAYWKALLDRADLSEKERLAVRRKYASAALDVRKEAFDAELEALKTERDEMEKNYAERTRIAGEAYRKIAAAYGEESKEAKKAYGEVVAEHRKFIDQQRQLDTLAAELRRQQASATVEQERLALQEQLALGTVNREQALAAERGFEERLYQIRLDALRERQALVDPARDPVAYAQVNQQIEQAELQHQQRLAQITQQMRLEALSPITGTLQSVQGAWAGLLEQMAKGTLTIGGFIRGVFKTAADAVIQTLAKMAAEWAVKQIAMRLFGKVQALGDITREAGKAGAGGTASMAAAPFPLNLGAPAFGAAMAAAAMSFAPLASAARGFDIPAGVNPMTQLHAREMVLPAPYADVIRGLAGGSERAPQEVHNHYHNTVPVSVSGGVDRRSQMQIAAEVLTALDQAQRNT